MKMSCDLAMIVAVSVGALAADAWAQPVVSSMSKNSGPTGTRVVLRGAGFGERGEGGYVEIGGVRAAHARWMDGLISVYVPGGIHAGDAAVRVVTKSGVEDAGTFRVEGKMRGEGPIAWKFQTDGNGVRQRGSVGADGTVYFSDTLGYLYAVDMDGDVRWIYCADCLNGTGAEGPVVIGHDGTVFVGGNPLGPDTNVHAVNPDGTMKWLYTGTWTTLSAGPGVGPDGRVYFVHENVGTGLTALDPQTGQIVWATHPPERAFLEFGEFGAEMVFGPSKSGGPTDRVYTMFDMRPLQPGVPQGAIGTIFSHSLDGSLNWERHTGGQNIAGGQMQGQPAAGPDGMVYFCGLRPPNAWALYAQRAGDGSEAWSLYLPPGNTMSEPSVAPNGTALVVRNTVHLHAVDPSGAVRWTYTDRDGALLKGPVASPDGGTIIAGGSVGDTENFSAHVRAVSAEGVSLWRAFVPREPNNAGGTVGFVVTTRAFYSPDSTRAYVGTSMAGTTSDEHAYVVALNIEPVNPPCAADFNVDGSVSSQDFFDFLNAFFDNAAAADFNDDGAVSSQDFFDFLAAFFVGC